MSERHVIDTTGSIAETRAVGAPRVSVVIPTYNEAANLPHVFALLPDDLYEVIVVDGRSTDGTIETAEALRPDVRIVLQNRRGKGNAMACGFAAVTGDIIVMLDADGSAHPGEIERYVSALTDGAHFAKGSRFVAGGGSNDITRLRKAGNWGLNAVANVLFGTRYTDLCYGYNAFWASCLQVLELDPSGESKDVKRWGDGFEIETLINARIAKAKLMITEVPSFEHPRLHGESNLNTFRDGFRVLLALAVERWRKPVRAAVRMPHQVGEQLTVEVADVIDLDAVFDATALAEDAIVPAADVLLGEPSAVVPTRSDLPPARTVIDLTAVETPERTAVHS
ncbi:glycosyltransferase [Kineococcus sp. T13]|uniref:glycosyltransferase family 2 protein n=1 Tax=Kineococcus vitellinus TaxID=2696565 RepID=UPI0014133904|nr:glycosyltransferase family 2 protein [Kineococcus vitellinus]NAZ74092.1 glycosyltransferase [Kineococcus vitellinus]